MQSRKSSKYLLFVLLSLFIVSSPNLLNFIFILFEDNSTTYDITIAFKHLIKELVSINVFISLLFTPLFILKERFEKAYLIIIIPLLFFSCFIDYMHSSLFKVHIHPSAYYSIFVTNYNEVIEFISDYLDAGFYFLLALFLLILLFSYFFLKRSRWMINRNLGYIWLFAAVIIAGILYSNNKITAQYFKEIPAFRIYQAYFDYKQEITRLTNIIDERTHRSFNKITKSHVNTENETYVFVIGESTSRHHLRIYGYQRNTNPKLSLLKKEELYLFNNVISPHAHTTMAMQKALTFANHENSDLFYSAGSVIELLNQAGFKTYWISNQVILGKNETLVSLLAFNADEKRFINQAGSKNSYDENLFPYLEEALEDSASKKAIFIHLMGTHLSYKDRYPTKFNYFNSENAGLNKKLELFDHEKQFIDKYDNAIRYNDSIIHSYIQILERREEPTALLYFSDHGDEVYDFRKFHGHSEALISRYMVDIPFILWLNDKYKTTYPDFTNNLNQYLSRKYSTEDLIHSIQDLCGVHTEYYDPERSILNKDFKFNERMIGDYDYDLTIASNNVYNQANKKFLDFDEKIWVHRVNSIERMKEIQDKFKGMEIDVVFNNNKNYFDITHPPAKSIGLSLETFFKEVNNIQNHYFWLDFKNLSDENRKESFSKLNKLAARFNIKKNIIVESVNPIFLNDFSNNGFITSYYLPDLYNKPEAGLMRSLDLISNNIEQSQVTAISQDIKSYGILNKSFSNSNKLIWDLSLNWKAKRDRHRVFQMLENDESIKVLLVRYETKGYR